MARCVMVALLGVLVSCSSTVHAQQDVESLAAEYGIENPQDLLDAANTVGVSPAHYLATTSPYARPPLPQPTALDRRVDCVIWRESRGNPSAVNPRSGASGLGQFLRSTWLSTPQGQAGYSVFDAAANRAAVAWMIAVGRGREFVTIGGC